MKTNLTYLLALTLLASATPQAIAGANCANSQSWQCTHHGSSTGTSGSGVVVPDHQTLNPGTTTTNPPLGSSLPDHHNVMLTPTLVPVPTPMQVPTPVPQQQPIATPHMVPQPMNIPGQVPTPVPQQQPIATPHMVPQPMNIPGQVPTAVPHPQPSTKPHQVPHLVTTPRPPLQHRPVIQISGGSQLPHPKPGQQHTGHMLAQHTPLPAIPSAGYGTANGQYQLEMIEPGIENHRVEVYRSQDAHERIYHDNIPVDVGGFNLTVIGTRNPDYMH